MLPFDSLFDFNRDGKLDVIETAAEYQFLDSMMHQSGNEDADSGDGQEEE